MTNAQHTPGMLKALKDAFCINDLRRAQCSRIDTDIGTPQMWRRLEKAGLVKKATASGKGPMGHRFSYCITDNGQAAIAKAGGK